MELRYFNKRRIANIISAVVILWCFILWSSIIYSILDNSYVDITHKDLLLTMLAVLSGASGYCLKHLMEVECGNDG